MAAIDDAKRFLFLHPYSTTDVDNPVQLLREVIDEVEADYDLIDNFPEPDDMSKVDRLMTFIKGLRDDLKISEMEYQMALQQVS